jgi:hypothetical protein
MSDKFTKNVRLVRGTAYMDATAICETTFTSGKRTCEIILQCELGTFRAADWDYFSALCTVRGQLETAGWRPFCYGASRNCFPSAMARDMGQGLKVYRTELGSREASKLVGLFDATSDVEPVSVEEQRAFRDEWFQSIGWPKSR